MTYDLTDPNFLTDPTPMLARMRAEGALVETKMPFLGKVYMTTTDAAARRVLKDQETFARNPVRAGGKSYDRIMWWLPGFMKPIMQNMLLHDGPEHKRLRGLVDKAFSRHAMLDMAPAIAASADALLDQIDPSRPTDIVSAYARPLPLLAICDLLGIPDEDRDKVRRWISPISAPVGPFSMMFAMPGLYKIIRYFRAEFAAVRAGNGRPGLIRDLVEVEQDGDRLNEDELLGMVVTLFVAGHETTVHLISNAIVGSLDMPGLGQRLAQNPDQLPIAIEEFMRFMSPVLMTKPLFVVHDTEVDGMALNRGDKVAAFLLGANHDPQRVDRPDEFQSDRRPNPHLGFGHGPHVCLGMQLARTEAQVALERLFLRFPNLEFAVPRAEIQRSRRIGIRGYGAVPVYLEAPVQKAA